MRYANKIHTAVCPVCGHVKNKLLYHVSSASAAAQFLVTQPAKNKASHHQELTAVINSLWKKDTATVVRCVKCTFVFTDPFISGDDRFYNIFTHANDADPVKDELYWKWEFDKTFKAIQQMATLNSDLKLIEIGASTGDFAKQIATIIPKQNLLCLEYGAAAAKRITEAGIEAHTWDFRELRSKPEYHHRFDVICLFQVLEHLDDLDATFNTFNKIIKPGGHLFIGVPNDKKIQFNELNGGLLDLPPNHIGRYNQKIFKLLGEKYLWKIVKIEAEAYSPLDVMKTVMYYRSLKRAQYPLIARTKAYKLEEYINIKKLRLKSLLMHKQLGETLWVHYQKPASTDRK